MTTSHLSIWDRLSEWLSMVSKNEIYDVLLAILAEVEELENHVHSNEHWYGQGGDSLLSEDSFTPWQLTAGAGGAFGSWVQLDDGTKIVSEGSEYDLHEIMVTDTSAIDVVYYIQFGSGEAGSQTPDTVFPYISPTNQISSGATVIQRQLVLTSEKLWARCACETDSETIDILVGMHFYE